MTEVMQRQKTGRNNYSNGLPFVGGLEQNVQAVKDRIRLKKASMVVIDGGVGEGKTTLAVHLLEFYKGSKIDYKCQYAIGGEQFQEKLQMCIDSGLTEIIYDEAGDFNKRGALTTFNRMLNRVFETFRAFGILVIIVLPSFSVLDNDLFDKQIPRFLIHCYGRSSKYGRYSIYSLYRMFYLRKKMKMLTVAPQAYGIVKPNCRGLFRDLSKKASEKLEAISMEGKRSVLSENVLRNKGLMTQKEICKRLGRSKAWFVNKVKEKKIKHNTVYKRAKYYDGDVLNVMQELMSSSK